MNQDAVLQRGYRVTGRVQGVFFRVWTRETALEMGVRGTVRNLQDGSVEVHAAGGREVLDAFQERLREGPPASRVEGVEVKGSHEPLPQVGFEILY